MTSYLLYGQVLDAPDDFGDFLISTDAPPTLRYRLLRTNPLDEASPGELLYQSKRLIAAHGNLPASRIWRVGKTLRIHMPEYGVYAISPKVISCYPFAHVSPTELRLCFYTSIIALWMEWMGIPALHASAVVLQGRTLGFLANSRGGKSTLAAQLLRAGCGFLTDDILAVGVTGDQVLGHFGYPWTRLWPETAEQVGLAPQELARVHPQVEKRLAPVGGGNLGEVCLASTPLGVLYIPERRDPAEWGDRVEIAPLSPGQAVIELLRYSYTLHLLRAIERESLHFDRLAQIAQRVPLRRLIYPTGHEYLPRVQEALLQDNPAPYCSDDFSRHG
jgi:hypothetical protein